MVSDRFREGAGRHITETIGLEGAGPAAGAATEPDQCYPASMNYRDIISIEPGKREGRPCISHMRIAFADVLGWLAAGQTHAQILDDFPELTEEDIRACLAYAADRERRLVTAPI